MDFRSDSCRGHFAKLTLPHPLVNIDERRDQLHLGCATSKRLITISSGETTTNTRDGLARSLAADTPKWKKITADIGTRAN